MTDTPPAFDKFGWLKTLLSDAALTDKDFRLAVLIGVTYTSKSGTGWAVELDALAAKLPGGLSRRRLIDALKRLTDRGYLVETSRSGGGRGMTARRSFDLGKPLTPASGVYAETPDASVRNPGQQRPKPLTAASHEIAADQVGQPPTGISTGISAGGAQVADDPEPSRYCSDHPNGTTEPCWACGQANNEHKAWRAREPERKSAAAQKRAAARADCAFCDDDGQIDLGDSVYVCDHTTAMARFKAQADAIAAAG
ncbi:hypothetical protein A5642_22085 [Mycolicibacterium mucogenicum]|uniref:Helix-turn-helix domain-containing protein n=1 Tax=Mycolicibacterium mucogenicum TaxID=56689 RepID=A0A1A0MMY1_MYCMU|nr:hypothetical protein [Mycolicibacterium mucogenicum]OBA86770.1 hypothetical protein A5642_22085 [Mycolicibacterium mucogenicum]